MASSRLFHLLTNPPVADYPDEQTIISATTPTYGRLTSMLLDPALPAAGATQYLATILPTSLGGPSSIIYGRWTTRQLPAQTIGAGTWGFYAVQRIVYSGGTLANTHNTLWGFCVAQWRQGTGVVARILDTPTGGADVANAGDRAAYTSAAGGAVTLQANDQIILEVWSSNLQFTGSGGTLTGLALLTAGLGLFTAQSYTANTLTDTDACLWAPAAITYS